MRLSKSLKFNNAKIYNCYNRWTYFSYWMCFFFLDFIIVNHGKRYILFTIQMEQLASIKRKRSYSAKNSQMVRKMMLSSFQIFQCWAPHHRANMQLGKFKMWKKMMIRCLIINVSFPRFLRLAMASIMDILKIKPFVEVSVGQLLWGYEDPLLKLAKDVVPKEQKLPYEEFGVLYGKNSTSPVKYIYLFNIE